MVKHIKRKVLSGVLLEAQLEEVVLPSEEIPGMVELDTPQLGESTPLILGVERIVDSGYCEDGSHTSRTNGELVDLSGGVVYDGRVGGEHGVGMKWERRWYKVVVKSLRPEA